MTAFEFADHGLVMSSDGEPFPAIVNGRLAPPPVAHLLDHLVRQYIVLEEDVLAHDPGAFELLMGEPGTTAMVLGGQLPDCDICDQYSRPTRPARYDGPASHRNDSAWAFLCPDCFAICAPPVLGLGRAQYLVTKTEIPAEVRDAFFKAREFWIAGGIEPPPHSPFE